MIIFLVLLISSIIFINFILTILIFMKTKHIGETSIRSESYNDDSSIGFLQMLLTTIPPNPDKHPSVLRLYRDEIEPFLVYCITQPKNSDIIYSYVTDTTYMGQYKLGFDQYATYYVINENPSNLLLINQINQVNYISIGNSDFYIEDSDPSILYRVNLSDNPETDDGQWGERQNPWMEGNLDTCCNGPLRPISTSSTMKITSIELNLCSSFVDFSRNSIGVYKLDKKTSQIVVGDGVKKGECLNTYLFASLKPTVYGIYTCDSTSNLYEYGIMRIAVPNVFKTDSSCKSYKTYDVQYFSIGSHQCNNDTDALPFWTVNAKMFDNIRIPNDPYIYIFFAPKNEVQTKMTDMHQYIPPIVTWGNRKGYLLQSPSYAFIFRYRSPSDSWPGSPVHAICYDKPTEVRPIKDELIDPSGINWCPSIYGDNFSSLEVMLSSPYIGQVPINGSWPSSQ